MCSTYYVIYIMCNIYSLWYDTVMLGNLPRVLKGASFLLLHHWVVFIDGFYVQWACPALDLMGTDCSFA